MYTVMIVDDEPIIRKGIANFIPWESINCQVSHEVTNGLEAIEILKKDTPDIIISDIKMPGMDGIELSKYIYENLPHVKVILLTGYSDFEYAQSAIRYNVVDFILKPSSNDKIIQAIENTKTIISKERSQHQKLEVMTEQLNENVLLLQEKFLYDFIKELHHNPSTLEKSFQDLNIHLENYHVIAFKFTTKTNNEAINIKANKQNILGEIKRFISIIFKDFNHYNITMDCRYICSIINIGENNVEDSTTFLLNKSKKLLDFFSDFMSIDIALGISALHKNFDQLQTAYMEADASLSLKFYEENKIFIYSECMPNESTLDKTLEHHYVDKILELIKSRKQDLAIATMHEFIEALKTSRQPIEYIKNVGVLLSSLCFKLLINHYIDLSEIIENSSQTYTNILNTDSISRLSQILEDLIISSIERISYLHSQDNYIIKKVTDYIEVNYNSQIKLNDLAALVHVNSSYLSRLIKQETGATLTEIITKTRIEKAKILLSLGNMKTYEIAIQVGIEDPAYFSQVFKKYTGLSPSEFKKIR